MSKQSFPPPTGGRKKILVVDDDQGIVDVMQIMLEGEGYEVRILTSGKGIQKQVLQYLPDVIFLDIWMPGIDGKQVTKLLKENDQIMHVSIVITSALNDTEKIAKDVGADDFLAKPFQMEDLLAKAKRYTNWRTYSALT